MKGTSYRNPFVEIRISVVRGAVQLTILKHSQIPGVRRLSPPERARLGGPKGPEMRRRGVESVSRFQCLPSSPSFSSTLSVPQNRQCTMVRPCRL
eukprot:5740021-Pyramimonas_sp.AAC.2